LGKARLGHHASRCPKHDMVVESEKHCHCYERPHSLCTSVDWMHAAMGPVVHAGLRDIKCVRVPHAVNPICLAGRRSGGFPSNFCLARGPVAGAKFLLTRGRHYPYTPHCLIHQTLTPNFFANERRRRRRRRHLHPRLRSSCPFECSRGWVP
jgi:hypothetical protein